MQRVQPRRRINARYSGIAVNSMRTTWSSCSDVQYHESKFRRRTVGDQTVSSPLTAFSWVKTISNGSFQWSSRARVSVVYHWSAEWLNLHCPHPSCHEVQRGGSLPQRQCSHTRRGRHHRCKQWTWLAPRSRVSVRSLTRACP